MTKYNEIMEKIILSPEARNRIIDNIADELSSDAGYVPVKVSKTHSKVWRKYITAAACCILVIAGAIAAARSDMFINLLRDGSADTVNEAEYSNELSMGNDGGSSDSKNEAAPEETIDHYSESDEMDAIDKQGAGTFNVEILESEEDLSDRLGFEISCTPVQEISEKAGMTEISYKVLEDSIGEISFSDGEKRNWFRKAVGTEDISGDHNLYDVEMEFDGRDCSGTLKGSMNDFKLAVWTGTDGYTYAAYIEDGLTDSEWLKIIDDMQ